MEGITRWYLNDVLLSFSFSVSLSPPSLSSLIFIFGYWLIQLSLARYRCYQSCVFEFLSLSLSIWFGLLASPLSLSLSLGWSAPNSAYPSSLLLLSLSLMRMPPPTPLLFSLSHSRKCPISDLLAFPLPLSWLEVPQSSLFWPLCFLSPSYPQTRCAPGLAWFMLCSQ